jgi:paraquat-inducible protein B
VPEIPTIPTTLQEITNTVTEALTKIRKLPIDQLVIHLIETVQGINALVQRVEKEHSVQILNDMARDIQQLVQHVDSQVASLADSLKSTLDAAHETLLDGRKLIQHIDSRVAPLVKSLEDTSHVARATLKDGQKLVQDVDSHVKTLTDDLTNTSTAARITLTQAQRTLEDDLARTLQELAGAARSIRLLAEYVERNPEALLYGKGRDRR